MIKLDRPICVFDLEATGTNVLEDRIVDICVLRREPDGTETVFSSLVRIAPRFSSQNAFRCLMNVEIAQSFLRILEIQGRTPFG